MSYNAIINAKIVLPDRVCEGSIVYEDQKDKICGIYEKGSEEEKSILSLRKTDAGGAWAVPGGIDPHVHFGGFGSIQIMDNFYTGSLGALAGGTITVIDFCEPVKDETARHCMERRFREAEQSVVDYAFHFVLTEDWRRQMSELDEIFGRGIGSFKLFTVYENTTLHIDEIEHIFASVIQCYPDEKIPFLIHAENPELIEERRKAAESFENHAYDMRLLAWTRPAESETEMVKKISAAADKYQLPVCIAHASTSGTVELTENNDCSLWLETCPHYLEYTEKMLKRDDGALYTMTPPLRKEEDRRKLWDGIISGKIHIFSTDHCPLRMPYLFSEGVQKRDLSMREYVRLTSENAARFYGMYPQKGLLAAGSDADIVLIREDGETEITSGNRKSDIDYTIYDGKKLSGSIFLTVKSGKIVYRDGNLYTEKGTGRYIRTGGIQDALF